MSAIQHGLARLKNIDGECTDTKYEDVEIVFTQQTLEFIQRILVSRM